MLDPIIQFLGAILSFLYQIFPNVGLAIVLLTVVVNLAMFPLTLKQTRSMKAMQEIQPLVKDLQKKHKEDRQQLNEEMVALYKEKGVNPAAGCLPMIIQLPIWFSLFRLLQSFRPGDADNTRFLTADSNLGEAIAAGDTGFLGMDMVVSPSEAISGGSITAALPYILLVIFIIVTGYYQQAQLTRKRAKDGSAANDTPQARQMQTFTKVLPVVFGFISYTLLAGVDLYIASGQVVRIGQQAFIIRLDERHAAAASAAPVLEPETPPDDQPTKKDFQGSKKKQQKRRRRY